MSIASALLAFVAGLFFSAEPSAPTAAPPVARSAAQAHVVQHLNGALWQLEHRDLSALSPTQRRNRAAAIALLEGYRDAGVFPQNRDFAGRNVPYFVDPVTGAQCAVGFLMAQTGHGELVRRIAATDNHVQVLDLARDAEVQAWLATYGFTLEEAARIQPWYEWEPILPPPSPPTSPGPIRDPVLTIPVPMPFPNTVEYSDPFTNELALKTVTGVSLGLFALQRFTSFGRESAALPAVNLVLGLAGTALSVMAPSSEPAAWRTAALAGSVLNTVNGISGIQRASAARAAARTGQVAAVEAPEPPRLRWSVAPTWDAQAVQARLSWSF